MPPDRGTSGPRNCQRPETRGPISTKGERFGDDGALVGAAAVMEVVGLRGVACRQGFVLEADEAVFVDCDPRFFGWVPLSRAACVNLAGEYVARIRSLPVRSTRLGYRPGMRMSRLFCEVFEGDAEVSWR